MIPEQAKLEIRRKTEAGQGWTSIANWLEQEYGISIHRTTIQRWYDKEVYSDASCDEGTDSMEERIKLDKKLLLIKQKQLILKSYMKLL